MKQIPLLILSLLLGFSSIAQISLVERIEYPDNDYYGYIVRNLPDHHILVKRKKEIKKGVYAHNYKVLNKDLKETHSTETVSDKGLTNVDAYLDGYNYTVLRRDYKKGKAKIYTYDFKSKKESVRPYLFPKKCGVNDFVVYGDYAYMQVRTKKNVPNYIRIINLKTGKSKDIVYKEEYNNEDLLFYDIDIIGDEGKEVDEELKELQIVFKYYENDHRYYVIHRYNEDGKKIGTTNFRVDDKHLLSLSFTKTQDKKHFLISGSYSSDNDNTASGMFFAKINMKGTIKFIKYKAFEDIDNFFTYLPEKQQEKMNKKIAKKKKKAEKKGKEFELEYRVATHDVYEHNGKYYYIGEFYYPTYRTECTTTTDANGTTRTNCRQVFDGYQYTHAAIAEYDERGNMTWNNIFEMHRTRKPYSVSWFINPNFHDDGSVDLVFIDGSWVESISFNTKGDKIGRKKFDPIATEDSDDKVKRVSGSMDFWYNNYLYIYGWQKIKNKEKKGQKKREVYYINLAKYE